MTIVLHPLNVDVKTIHLESGEEREGRVKWEERREGEGRRRKGWRREVKEREEEGEWEERIRGRKEKKREGRYD